MPEAAWSDLLIKVPKHLDSLMSKYSSKQLVALLKKRVEASKAAAAANTGTQQGLLRQQQQQHQQMALQQQHQQHQQKHQQQHQQQQQLKRAAEAIPGDMPPAKREPVQVRSPQINAATIMANSPTNGASTQARPLVHVGTIVL
jgi:transcription initiation factor TFIID subunit TAF12